MRGAREVKGMPEEDTVMPEEEDGEKPEEEDAAAAAAAASLGRKTWAGSVGSGGGRLFGFGFGCAEGAPRGSSSGCAVETK